MIKSKSIVFWSIFYLITLVCFIISFPVLLFTFYPYSIIGIILYPITVILLSLLAFKKKNTDKPIFKTILFYILLLPVITLAILLISIEIGWIHFPG